MEPANVEAYVLALKILVVSWLAKLTVEFLFIPAGHPRPVVLMHRLANNLAYAEGCGYVASGYGVRSPFLLALE